MSTPGSTMPPGMESQAGATAPRSTEIKLISHSQLFYWWPIWLLSFIFALWTLIEDHRMAILPAGGSVEAVKNADDSLSGEYKLTLKGKDGTALKPTELLETAVLNSASSNPAFPMRVSAHPFMGVMFCITLLVTIIITNVPLRGLWSFVVLMAIALLAVLITLFNWWDDIFTYFQALRIHINLGGYVLIGTVMFILWAVATFFFDRRAYVIFTPGQIRICEHIGSAVETFPTIGVSLTKQRDDLFRHYIFGFGSGDLILKFSTGDRREVRIPNVLGIGWQLRPVEDMLRIMPA